MRRSAVPTLSNNVLFYDKEFDAITIKRYLNNILANTDSNPDSNPDLAKIKILIKEGGNKEDFLTDLIKILMSATQTKNSSESAILDTIKARFGKVLQPDQESEARLQDAQREVKQQLKNYNKSLGWLRWGWNKVAGEPSEIRSLRQAANSSLDSNGAYFFQHVDLSILQKEARRQFVDETVTKLDKKTSSRFWNGVNALRKAWIRLSTPDTESIFKNIGAKFKNTIPNATEKNN